MTEETQEIVYLSLDQLVVGENIRFGLKPYRVQDLARSIHEMGGIQTALKVEPFENGTFMIREGHYRHAAALWLKERGVPIVVPCIIEPQTAPLDRILKQLSENHDRENLSPMDTANAIHALIALGKSKAEIMEKFSRPGGKGKTPTMEKMSHAAYSYYTRYRELPAEVQDMLHHGTLHITAANRFLDESDPKKRVQLLAEAERKRQERISQEEARDKRLEKVREENAKLEAALAKNRETAEAKAKEIEGLEKQFAEKKTVSDAAFKAIGNLKGKERTAAHKAYLAKANETNQVKAQLKTAEEARKKAQSDIRRTAKTRKVVEVEQRAQKHRTALSKRDVQAAAAAADQSGRTKLGASDMRAAVKDWAEAPYPKVKAIALIIQRTYDSILTSGQARREMAKVTGEEKRRPKARRGK